MLAMRHSVSRNPSPYGIPVSSTEPDRESAWVAQIQRQLIDWYAQGHRELPWRGDRNPYRILVAEMMLVQTTVASVTPHFERFLSVFPDVETLAHADESEVLRAWEGLGYYRRARQLQKAARAIVEQHGGRVPDDEETLRALPGVGRYIAGAILSFAFNRPAPIVEANTRRVLARWIGWEDDIASAATQARLWQAAERITPTADAGTFNQAFMELGAVVCSPRDPKCLICPVSLLCRARACGRQHAIPVVRPRKPPLSVAEACALVVGQGRVLILKREACRLWEGFWEFPTVHVAGADPAGRSFGEPVDLAGGVQRLTDVHVEVGPVVRTVRFSVTKHRVVLTAYAAIVRSGPTNLSPSVCRAIWEHPEALVDYPLASAYRRLANWVSEQGADVIERKFRS
jgi:A/G-specific adenine glycosylase